MNYRAVIASPLVIFMIMATRLLLVSNYNGATAVAILRTGGATDTALGLAIPLLPILLPSIFVLLLVLRRFWLAGVAFACSFLVASATSNAGIQGIITASLEDARWYWFGVVDILLTPPMPQFVRAFFVGLLRAVSEQSNMLSPINPTNLDALPRAHTWSELWDQQRFLSVLVIITISLSVMGLHVDLEGGSVRRAGGNSGPWPVRMLRYVGRIFWPGARYGVILTIGFLVASNIYPIPPKGTEIWRQSLYRVWLTPEKITLSSGETFVAYSLGEKDKWWVMMSDKGRLIRYAKPEEVKARVVCSLPNESKGRPYWVAGENFDIVYDPCYPPTMQHVADSGRPTASLPVPSDAATAPEKHVKSP